MSNELSGTTVNAAPFRGGQTYAEYIIDITEAEYEDTESPLDENKEHSMASSYEYRSMKTILTTHGMGAVWFKYDIAPLKVHYRMYH